ncbi:MAG: carboxylating nicotinate-nucleotide diphosphorylase [Proteobacteria bacterium]|nr:carboxylating nicotinate-nucleotide diphosphorylase [Pseudomonadota bacterium]MDA1058126.1 carboxylating nicotinate-nucleotide diphosphorylase [Pseudomonadota bacterium]
MASLPAVLYEPTVRAALAEDLGTAGDLTSDAAIPEDARATADIVARKAGRIAGIDVALCAFRLMDAGATLEAILGDGADAAPGAVLARIEGNARALLAAERTALNFLGRLCGIATATRTAVDAVQGTSAHIACTRKTTPGLRHLEKYAVRIGGGHNHRFGLHDAVLIKDNHLIAGGGISATVARVCAQVGHLVMVQVEVDTLAQLEELLTTQADAVLLDNMTPDQLRAAVALVAGRLTTEASGGIRPETLKDIAASGVDVISLGWLTHSAPALDVGLDFRG